MRNTAFILILIFIFFSSCKENVPETHAYNTNPAYTWGYAEFFGTYYSNYNNNNNVVSLSLFTDSLYADSTNAIAGLGEYLFLEDIFSAPSDTLLPEGTYTISDSKEPFTVAKGEELDFDGLKYTVGAYIYFIEKNSAYSTKKLISSGSFTLNYLGSNYYILCNFVLSDKTVLKGKFNTKKFPYIDESVSYPAGVPRKKPVLKFPQANL